VNWYGELKLGIQHQDTNGLWTTENSFWQQWDHNTKNMYMLLSIKDYNRLKQERQHALYEIARTKRDILTTNRSNLS